MPAPEQQDWIDRVDQADHVVGRIRRGEARAGETGFRTVHVFAFDPAGRLLLQKLSGFRRRNPLQWGSSVASHLHSGESYHDAARRRLREELGLTSALFKRGSTPMRDGQATKFVTLYTTLVDELPTIREPAHIAEISFFPLDEIRDLLERSPLSFTETFRHVFRFYEATAEMAGADSLYRPR